MNEFGLVIGETTFGGVAALQHQEGAQLDYGNLEWITLQRAKTARQAIHVLDGLMQTYGYYSEGTFISLFFSVFFSLFRLRCRCCAHIIAMSETMTKNGPAQLIT